MIATLAPIPKNLQAPLLLARKWGIKKLKLLMQPWLILDYVDWLYKEGSTHICITQRQPGLNYGLCPVIVRCKYIRTKRKLSTNANYSLDDHFLIKKTTTTNDFKRIREKKGLKCIFCEIKSDLASGIAQCTEGNNAQFVLTFL